MTETLYVDGPVAPNTVNTMPEATAAEDHGRITGNTITVPYKQTRADLDAVERPGISYDGVARLVEDESVAKSERAWNDLLASTETERLDSKEA